MSVARVARLALALLVGPAIALTVVGPTAPADAAHLPRPVTLRGLPDPVVVQAGHRWVAFGTGRRVPRSVSRRVGGGWKPARNALVRRPGWARRGGIWAVDVDEVGGQWVMYFSAPIAGLGKDAHCIGVATARSPLGRFRPVDGPPLVCPGYGAEDLAGAVDTTLPRAGAIDPNLFVDASGLHLLYKTDRRPSSIRLLTLDPTGLHAQPGTTSVELLRSDDVVENPVLLPAPDGGYVLLVSNGDWTRCEYRTDWYSSRSLTDWQTTASGTLVSTETTAGLCGTGGADVTQAADGPTLFLHGWTCHRRPRPCRGTKKWDHHQRRFHGVRSLYAARLGWSGSVPVITSWR